MTIPLPDLTVRECLDITAHRDGATVVVALRDAVARINAEEHIGIVWWFELGRTESMLDELPTLIVGVRGQIGALTWYDNDGGWVPANGMNERSTNWVDDPPDSPGYWTPSGHDAGVPAHAELPVEQVYAALEEWVRTHERPTCVQWQAVPDPYSG